MAGSPPADRSDDETGVPGLITWRRVYIVVVGCFILWIGLLTVLMRTFS